MAEEMETLNKCSRRCDESIQLNYRSGTSNIGHFNTCQIEMPFKGQFFTSVMQAESMSHIVAISTELR